jgi:hypothetical protein
VKVGAAGATGGAGGVWAAANGAASKAQLKIAIRRISSGPPRALSHTHQDAPKQAPGCSLSGFSKQEKTSMKFAL